MNAKVKPSLFDLQADVHKARAALNACADDDKVGIALKTKLYRAAKERVRVFSFQQKQSVTASGHALRL